MTDREIEALVHKHIKLMKGKPDYQALLDNIKADLPIEPWENIPGYSEQKANLLYDGDYWKIARWLIDAIQEDICPDCGKKLNGSFELHHHRRGGDYFNLRIAELKAVHHNCHKKVHRVSLKKTFKDLITSSKKKENERIDNTMSKKDSLLITTVKMIHRDQNFKNLFDSKYDENYVYHDKDEDRSMYNWLSDEFKRRDIPFATVGNPAAQMADIRNKLAEIGLMPDPCRHNYGYVRRKFPNRKKTKNVPQAIEKISDATVTSVIGGATVTSAPPIISSEMFTKEELIAVLKLQKAGLISI